MGDSAVIVKPDADVPCNGCTACCHHDLVMLHPEMGDKPADYLTFEAENPLTGERGLALRHKPQGGCVYVSDAGCDRLGTLA